MTVIAIVVIIIIQAFDIVMLKCIIIVSIASYLSPQF